MWLEFRWGRGQRTLWAEIRTASHAHVEIAFKQRRRQIVGGCWQLRSDVDSYNDNNVDEAAIQMVLDFTEDMEEFELGSDECLRRPRDRTRPFTRRGS